MLEVKYILADGSLTYRRAVRFLDDKKYVIFRTREGDEVTQDKLFDDFATRGIYDKVFAAGAEGETSAEERAGKEGEPDAEIYKEICVK